MDKSLFIYILMCIIITIAFLYRLKTLSELKKFKKSDMLNMLKIYITLFIGVIIYHLIVGNVLNNSDVIFRTAFKYLYFTWYVQLMLIFTLSTEVFIKFFNNM